MHKPLNFNCLPHIGRFLSPLGVEIVHGLNRVQLTLSNTELLGNNGAGFPLTRTPTTTATKIYT
jgi:hypothetical protein